jgi:hypothetical protein
VRKAGIGSSWGERSRAQTVGTLLTVALAAGIAVTAGGPAPAADDGPQVSAPGSDLVPGPRAVPLEDRGSPDPTRPRRPARRSRRREPRLRRSDRCRFRVRGRLCRSGARAGCGAEPARVRPRQAASRERRPTRATASADPDAGRPSARGGPERPGAEPSRRRRSRGLPHGPRRADLSLANRRRRGGPRNLRCHRRSGGQRRASLPSAHRRERAPGGIVPREGVRLGDQPPDELPGALRPVRVWNRIRAQVSTRSSRVAPKNSISL